ncbi:PREDICTED: uncharacterized protein LOC106806848 [Priapulus caudatus]|uniref:Uncharacterized protein LOC106806848 n=1 Tax=Priapulus caudatus TaxID=37621 RepID=A0ABM1DWZ1_PRICU|nr:PREDICTED: uncharacterized protein LOC106806848 [Priapulus caudatus]XP_014664462.1 PREDICTED: uncharacterized protein LOC106806848 [Priapulus caudatus]XP_014664463.1 PREDICTED: uncharacterized protein LOC106806848 [Priapulus caudatus]XP_014664464.1 PREDICTED: uncharacterized protein LOC106806848 [Priapulus caudatus]
MPKKLQGNMISIKRLRSLEHLTLDEIERLPDKHLVEVFAHVNSDELNQKYTFQCMLMPHHCQTKYTSFRNEGRGKMQMQAHLMLHIQDLQRQAKAEGKHFTFTAESVIAKKKKEEAKAAARKRLRKDLVPKSVAARSYPSPKPKIDHYSESDSSEPAEENQLTTVTSQKQALLKNRRAFIHKKKSSALYATSPTTAARGSIPEDNDESVVMTSCKNGRFVSRLMRSGSSGRSNVVKCPESVSKNLRACSVYLGKAIKTESTMEESEDDRWHESAKSRVPKIEQLSSEEECDSTEEAEKNHALRAEEKRLRREQMRKELNPDSDVGEESGDISNSSHPLHDHCYTTTGGPKYDISSDSEVDIETCEDERNDRECPLPNPVHGIRLDGLHYAPGSLRRRAFPNTKKHAGLLTSVPPRRPQATFEQLGIDPKEMDNLSTDDTDDDAEAEGKESHKKRKPGRPLKGTSEWERRVSLKAIRKIRLYKNRGEKYPLTCKICKTRNFTALATLTYHYRSHAGIKPFVCTVCGTTFTRQHSLNYHMLIHNNESRFACPECDRTFRHPSHFKEHLRKHTGETPFQCVLCHLCFKTRNSYKRHLRTRHEKNLTSTGVEDIDVGELERYKAYSHVAKTGGKITVVPVPSKMVYCMDDSSKESEKDLRFGVPVDTDTA